MKNNKISLRNTFYLVSILLLVNIIGIAIVRLVSFNYEIDSNCYSRRTSSWLLRPPFFVTNNESSLFHTIPEGEYTFKLDSYDQEVDKFYYLTVYDSFMDLSPTKYEFSDKNEVSVYLEQGNRVKIHTWNPVFTPQRASICIV